MRRLMIMSLLLSTPAFAGDVRFNVNFGNWRVRPAPTRAFVPQYQPYAYYWVVVPPAPPPPPPQIIYVEKEVVREQPPPQVVVVQLEAPPPVVLPEPLAPAPPPVVAPVVAVPAAPPAPRVPGPDVFQWTDDDGVVNYSTRVPADARKRARKLSALAK